MLHTKIAGVLIIKNNHKKGVFVVSNNDERRSTTVIEKGGTYIGLVSQKAAAVIRNKIDQFLS